MTTKTPEGVTVFIDTDFYNSVGFVVEGANGLAFTHEQLAERDRAIARAAWEASAKASAVYFAEQGITCTVTAPVDDYLQSEEFKELTKDDN